MDLATLMNSLSVNDKEESSASNFKLFKAVINNTQTDIVFGEFSNQCMLIATHSGKLATLLKVTKDQPIDDLNSSEPVYTVQVVFGTENIEAQAAARYIAEKLNITKPLMVFLHLNDYNRDTILKLLELLNNFSPRT